jgi:hypothetical protein
LPDRSLSCLENLAYPPLLPRPAHSLLFDIVATACSSALRRLT